MSVPDTEYCEALDHILAAKTEIKRLKAEVERLQAELKQQGAELAAALLNPKYKAGWEDGYKTARTKAAKGGK